MNMKTCTKCSKVFPATLEHFYKNAGGKFGVTPRCKPCVNEDNDRSHAARVARDPEGVRAQANARAKASYRRNLEANRIRQCEHQKKARADLVKGLKIKARKRAGYAGLSPEGLEAIFAAQDYRCAICETQEPQGIKGSMGWNVDHCHKSGVVRYILCSPCNRGLAAFRENPVALRKAADLMEIFHAGISTNNTKTTTDHAL